MQKDNLVRFVKAGVIESLPQQSINFINLTTRVYLFHFPLKMSLCFHSIKQNIIEAFPEFLIQIHEYQSSMMILVQLDIHIFSAISLTNQIKFFSFKDNLSFLMDNLFILSCSDNQIYILFICMLEFKFPVKYQKDSAQFKSQLYKCLMMRVRHHESLLSLVTPLSKMVRCKFSVSSDEDYKKAEQYVLETLRSRSWTDYMISSYYPKSLRTAFCTIQLFNLELIKISDNIKQPSLGLGRLDFWRGVINKIYASEKPNPEPISICLNHACHNNPLTKGYFDRIINSRAEELTNRNIESVDQMLTLSQNTYSTLTALNLELLRIDIEKQHQQLISKFGRSVGICSYLKRVPYGLRNYRFLVPLDIMDKYNVQPMKIWDRIHGKPSEEYQIAYSKSPLTPKNHSKNQCKSTIP